VYGDAAQQTLTQGDMMPVGSGNMAQDLYSFAGDFNSYAIAGQ
jgi:hypothetical protein